MQLLLRALQHPQADSAQMDAFRNLVMWLEDRKIRAYKVEDRRVLADIQTPQWHAAYDTYLQQLGCPAPVRGADAEAQLLWLLRLAVAREYEDNKAVLGKAVPAAAPKAASVPQPKQRKPHLDVSSDAASAQLRELLQRISSAAGGSAANPAAPLPQALQEAHIALTHRVLPALAAGRQGAGETAASDFPLGFSTSDGAVNKAATMLRILYTQELRKLQSLIDDSIVEVQEFTSNPRTDSALGRTGR